MKKCEICQKNFSNQDLFPISLLKTELLDILEQRHSSLSLEGYICTEDLKKIRAERIQFLLEEEKGELSTLELEVLESFKTHEILTENLNKEFESKLTFGQKLADTIAKFGGSWKFISLFGFIIIVWMAFNTIRLLDKPFDPYPFILLNLFLSCLAAIQAPIIMMSQNRQAAKERMRTDNEYTTNLKAELEIRQLHAKIDQLMKKHWGRLLEIQQMQIDLSEEILKKNNQNKNSL